jgi:O-antigen ligase
VTRTRRTGVVATATAAIVIAANASQGAYFSQSWGWVALAFLVPTTVLLILERVTVPGRLRIAFAALIGAFAVWIALSSLWSISSASSLRELERMLVYVGVALAVAFVLRRGDTAGLLGGIVLGTTVVCGYSLATRVLPDRFETQLDLFNSYRLADPIGYWNALGLLAALGLIVALGVVAQARRVRGSILSATALPVLVSTLYFTFSRGAWAALAIGVIAMVVLDPRRLRLLWTGVVVAIPSAACLAYAAQQEALSTQGSVPAAAAHEGHRLAVVVVIAMAASGFAAWIAQVVAARVGVSSRARRRVDVLLACAALAAVLVGLAAVGGPSEGLSRLRDRFEAAPVATADLNERLFSLSGNGRTEQLRVAWDAAKRHPVIGSGSGTFEYLWYEHRPDQLVVRDAHSLYAETLAELGVVGLGVLGAALLVLLVGGARARRTRFAASGTAAFVAWAAAATFDWHWEVVGVTLTALLAGASAAAESERRAPRPLGSRTRGALVAVLAVLSVAAVLSLVGNQALFAAREAVDRKDWSQARDDGRRAHALLPWSFEPELVLGDAAAGLGDREGALRDYREAVDKDPQNWVAWLRVAQVARGEERRAAYAQVRELNPREQGLPGG